MVFPGSWYKTDIIFAGEVLRKLPDEGNNVHLFLPAKAYRIKVELISKVGDLTMRTFVGSKSLFTGYPGRG